MLDTAQCCDQDDQKINRNRALTGPISLAFFFGKIFSVSLVYWASSLALPKCCGVSPLFTASRRSWILTWIVCRACHLSFVSHWFGPLLNLRGLVVHTFRHCVMLV